METCNPVTENQKESIALSTMRTMLTHYAERNGISFDNAFLRFTHSRAYDALFDFETGIWREGPDYLESIFREAYEVSQFEKECNEE